MQNKHLIFNAQLIIMRNKKLALSLLFLFSALIFLISAQATLVLAQQTIDLQNYLGSWFSIPNLVKFLFPGYPDEWLRIPEIIFYVIIPFITAFTVLYGLLIELKIFRNQPKVNTVLAFAMAFLLMPSGILTQVVTIFYAGGAFIGVMAFIVVFIIGVLIWGYGTSWRFWGTYGSARDVAQNIRNINSQIRFHQQQIQTLQQNILNNPNSPNVPDWQQQILNHQNAIASLQATRTQMQQALQSVGTT